MQPGKVVRSRREPVYPADLLPRELGEGRMRRINRTSTCGSGYGKDVAEDNTDMDSSE